MTPLNVTYAVMMTFLRALYHTYDNGLNFSYLYRRATLAPSSHTTDPNKYRVHELWDAIGHIYDTWGTAGSNELHVTTNLGVI